MFLYGNKQFKQINEIRKNYNLISLQEIMRYSGAGTKPVSEAMHKLNINPEVILLKPSNKTIRLYKRDFLPQLIEIIGTEKKVDVIPEGYISKKEFAVKFGVNPYTVNNMSTYFSDFNKYAEYFYIDNVKTKFFLMTEEAESFYREKVEKYTTPFSKRRHFIKTNLKNNREYSEGNLHKIAFDYDILTEIFDTKSRFFQLMIKIYKKYAKLQIADSSRMD